MSEPGPLVLVHVDPVRVRRRDLERRRADMHADAQARLSAADLDGYIGMGWTFPYPSQSRAGGRGEWLHLYATTRPTRLEAALAAVGLKLPEQPVVIATSADGNLLFDPSTGSCVMPPEWG